MILRKLGSCVTLKGSALPWIKAAIAMCICWLASGIIALPYNFSCCLGLGLGGTNDCFVLVEVDEDNAQVPGGVVSVLPPNEEPPSRSSCACLC